jgi:hypothetical protein
LHSLNKQCNEKEESKSKTVIVVTELHASLLQGILVCLHMYEIASGAGGHHISAVLLSIIAHSEKERSDSEFRFCSGPTRSIIFRSSFSIHLIIKTLFSRDKKGRQKTQT